MDRAQLQEHLAQADRHMAELSLDLQSAVVTPISPQTHEGSNEEIGSHQVEALKNRITELEDAKEQAAHTIATLEAAEQESRDSDDRRQRLLQVAGFYRSLAGIIPEIPTGYKGNGEFFEYGLHLK